MKSIEERAQIAGQVYQFSKERIEADHKVYEKGYIQGAFEQKAIDIEKACEWLKDNCRGLVSYNNAIGGVTYPFIEAFCKAMRE